MKTDRGTPQATPDVLIVGAGPTGLTLANLLVRCGVAFRIIDQKPGPTSEQKHLFHLLHDIEHHILLFEGRRPTGTMEDLQQQVRTIFMRYRVPFQFHVIPKENRDLHQRYHAERTRLYVIRPDGYIAYRGQPIRLNHLDALYDRRMVRSFGSNCDEQ